MALSESENLRGTLDCCVEMQSAELPGCRAARKNPGSAWSNRQVTPESCRYLHIMAVKADQLDVVQKLTDKNDYFD